jgi:hypothetical protein
MKNKFFSPWVPYDHPILGKVEIGGSRGIPPAVGDRAKFDCESQYDWLLYVADLSPLLRIKDLTAAPAADGTFKVTATVKNEGCLSTYVTRNAIQVRRDYPVLSEIKVTGAEVLEGSGMQSLGHILGKWAYIRNWIEGQDRSTKTVAWTIRPSGPGPIQVTVEARAPKAGTDKKTIVIDWQGSKSGIPGNRGG